MPCMRVHFFLALENLGRLGPDRVLLSVDRQRELSQLVYRI